MLGAWRCHSQTQRHSRFPDAFCQEVLARASSASPKAYLRGSCSCLFSSHCWQGLFLFLCVCAFFGGRCKGLFLDDCCKGAFLGGLPETSGLGVLLQEYILGSSATQICVSGNATGPYNINKSALLLLTGSSNFIVGANGLYCRFFGRCEIMRYALGSKQRT